jgi:hypothetical protein
MGTSGERHTFVRVSVDNSFSSGTTLEKILKAIIKDYKGNRESFNFQVIKSTTDATLAGLPAYMFVYTQIDKGDGLPEKGQEIGVLIHDKLYFINYSADPDKYSNYLPMVQKIIESFKLKSNSISLPSVQTRTSSSSTIILFNI